MAEPLISVIVPVYKVEPWLERCVESIRNQTYRNLEILLVDDGSPDRCGEICDRLAREDDRIKVIHRENGGLSAARNSGLDVCRGEYIGCVDSDDLIHPEMYARLYADLVAYGTKLAFCQPLVCYDANISFPPMEAKVACFTKNELLQKSLVDIIWFSAWTKLYHRDLFEGIRYPEGRINEDYPVTIRLFDKCDRIAVDFNQLYAYCKRTGSITTSASCRSAFDQIINAEEVASYIKETHPDLLDHADFILLSSCLGFLLKTDVASPDEWKEKRKEAFALIRKHFPEERHNPRLSSSQKALLAAANAGAGRYRVASWFYRTLKRRQRRRCGRKPVLFRWIIALISFVLLEYCFEYLRFDKFNQSPLSLETIEGTGQAYHPAVLFFQEPWQGYRYWMAETPYPIGFLPYRDRWECPSIHVSQDGLHWQTPQGLTNPIDDLAPSEFDNRDFFSDPHLVFKEGQLECFYRYSENTEGGYHTSLVRKTSPDGVHWSDRELLLDFYESSCLATVGDMVRSPAILWQDGRYRMWYVDNVDPNGIKHVRYSESPDGRNWSVAQTCALEGRNVEPWHLDLAFIDGVHYLTLYDFHDLTLWESSDGTSFVFSKTILSPSGVPGCFYSDGLYRSSLISDNENYKLYFSAFDDRQTRIGLMEGPNPEQLQVLRVDGPHHTLLSFFKPFRSIWKVRLWRALQALR